MKELKNGNIFKIARVQITSGSKLPHWGSRLARRTYDRGGEMRRSAVRACLGAARFCWTAIEVALFIAYTLL